jgi:hypothetical protein
MQLGGQAPLARLVAGRSDAEIEKRFGRGVMQKAIFGAMARAYVPEVSAGFEGEIIYELRHVANVDCPSDVWTLRVRDGSATAVPGNGGSPAVLLWMALPDFARSLSGELHPAAAMSRARSSSKATCGWPPGSARCSAARRPTDPGRSGL